MVEDGKFRVEKFSDQNYQLWKMQMEDYICQSFPTVGREIKADSEYEGRRMGGS
jgi:hypothetical protein